MFGKKSCRKEKTSGLAAIPATLVHVRLWPCAPKARIISGGRIPPRELSIDLVADERLSWVTGRAGAS
jgi:hypothetical protein